MSIADKSDANDSKLLLDDASGQGWSLSDLKQISKVANNKRSESTTARVKALARTNILARTLKSDDGSFRQKIFRLNPAVRVLVEAQHFVQVELAGNFKLPKLPIGYGFKGGSARIALLNVLGVNTSKLNPRDFDIVRIGGSKSEKDLELAARLMPDDFKYGHGVELQPDYETYFNTRDLTVNEIILSGNKLTFSKIAFTDLQSGTVRLSTLYSKDIHKLNPKLICKMLRIKAELESLGINGKLVLPEKLPLLEQSDKDFYFKRCLELGEQVAQIYSELLSQYFGNKSVVKKTGSSLSDCSVLNPQNELQRFRMRHKKRP